VLFHKAYNLRVQAPQHLFNLSKVVCALVVYRRTGKINMGGRVLGSPNINPSVAGRYQLAARMTRMTLAHNRK